MVLDTASRISEPPQRPDGGGMLARLGLPAETGDALYWLAYSNFLAGRVARAEEALHALLLAEPLKPQPYLGLGIIQSRRGDLRLAELLFRTATECQPDMPLAHYHLAATLLQQGRLEDASASLRSFFEHVTPKFPREIVREAKRMRRYIEAGRDNGVAGSES